MLYANVMSGGLTTRCAFIAEIWTFVKLILYINVRDFCQFGGFTIF